MKTLLFISTVKIGEVNNVAYYADYQTAIHNATYYVEEADEIKIEVYSLREGYSFYTYEDVTWVKTKKHLRIEKEAE